MPFLLLFLQGLLPIAISAAVARLGDDEAAAIPPEAVVGLDALLAVILGAAAAQTDPALADLRARIARMAADGTGPTGEDQAALDAWLEAQRVKAFGTA